MSKRFHKAGETTVQDLIADTLGIHPEFIKVTENPISMMIKYNEDGTASLLHASDPEIYNGEFWSMLQDNITDAKSGCILKDSDMLFLLHRNDKDRMIIDEILVYKKAHMAKVKREFDTEITRIGKVKGSWEEIEENNPIDPEFLDEEDGDDEE